MTFRFLFKLTQAEHLLPLAASCLKHEFSIPKRGGGVRKNVFDRFSQEINLRHSPLAQICFHSETTIMCFVDLLPLHGKNERAALQALNNGICIQVAPVQVALVAAGVPDVTVAAIPVAPVAGPCTAGDPDGDAPAPVAAAPVTAAEAAVSH